MSVAQWFDKACKRMGLKTGSQRVSRPRATAHHRLSLEALEPRQLMSATPRDFLYVGDGGNDTVKRFDAETGAYLGEFVASGGGGLHGPRGIVFDRNKLTLVNQNVDTEFNGAVLRFNEGNGTPIGDLVDAESKDAPFAPRGIVIRDGVAYVADVVGADGSEGRIARYDIKTGKYLGDLAPSSTSGFSGPFHPRGVVFGPDGALYVTAFDGANPLAGHVFRCDTGTGDWRVVAANDGDGIAEPGETYDLHRPEGIAFGPDARMYVTSYQADAADNDKILIFQASSGRLVDTIDVDAKGLDASGKDLPRAIPQTLLFGPGGDLFVPITNAVPSSVAVYDTGAVRRYRVDSPTDADYKSFTYFVQPHDAGGALMQPWYLTFGQTSADTLDYPARMSDRVCYPSTPWFSPIATFVGDRMGRVPPVLVHCNYGTEFLIVRIVGFTGGRLTPNYGPALPWRGARPGLVARDFAPTSPREPMWAAHDAVFARFHEQSSAFLMTPHFARSPRHFGARR